MTKRTHTFRLIVLALLAMLVVSACAAGDPAPAADSNAQTAATTAPPAAADPTEEPAPVQATEAPAAVEPTEEAAAVEATEAPAAEEPAAGGGERTFALDPANTVVSYEVDEEFGSGALDRLGIAAGLTKTVGRTSTVDGALTMNFDGATPQLVDANFVVDISTLTSNQRMRDGRIRRPVAGVASLPHRHLPGNGDFRMLRLPTARATKSPSRWRAI